MKRQLLIALLLGLSATICYSQVKINAQAGTGLTGITKNENYNANFGYRFGFGVEFPINRTWSLQTGLHFLRKNYSVDDSSLIQNSAEGGGTYLFYEKIKSKINATYVQLPIKIAAYLPLNTNCGLQFSTGTYIAYGIAGKTKTEIWRHSKPDDGEFITQDYSAEYTSSWRDTFDKNYGSKKLDIGLSIGADFKYKFLFIGVGAEYGFLPISKKFPKDLFEGQFNENQPVVSPHNIGIEFHVGFCFDTGKR